MFTKTIIPDSTSVTIQLPDSYVGEEVRLIAVIEKKWNKSDQPEDKVNMIRKKYSTYPRIDLSSFSFDRDEANDFS